MVFFRILGFYLSGFIMIVISLDRLSAIMFPIWHRSNTKRTKIMLIIAWTMAPLSALPQTFIFQLKKHPLKTDYWQCTTIGYFESHTMVRLFLQLINLIDFVQGVSLFYLCLNSDLAPATAGDVGELPDHHSDHLQEF